MQTFNRLIIIPARGGSKRIKNKNIKKFRGKPIIFYSINSAKKSKLFDFIHVSTESLRIKKILKNILKINFMRPKNLSLSKTPIHEVLKNVVENFIKNGIKFKEIWCMMPCAPNIDSDDLIKASNFYEKKKRKLPVYSVSKYKVPIEWSNKLDKKGVLSPINRKAQMIRSQDLKDKYYDAGQFYIFPGNKISKLNFKKNNFLRYGYVLPFSKSIDIDDDEDWKIAEKIH